MKTLKTKASEFKKISEVIFLKEAEEIIKYANVGRISCDILHDVLNPVSGLLLFLEVNNTNKDMNNIISPIIKANNRIRNFIKNISASIAQPSNQQIVNMENHVRDVLEIMSPKALSKDVALNFIRKYEANLLISNSLNIYQILINLVSNALDAFDNVGDDRKREVNLVLDKDFKNNLCIRVRDNGCGISEANLENIFKSNFSTKEKGTGIGLSHTKYIVEQELNGKIKFNSKLGEGTEFIITVPHSRLITN